MDYREGTQIYRSHDKHGRTIYFRFCRSMGRNFRIAKADVEVGIATGRYKDCGVLPS